MDLAHRLVHTRRGTLIVSAVAALLAGGMILAYLSSYRSSLKAEAAPVTVLVADGPIAKGTPASAITAAGLSTVATVREGQLLDGAVSDASALRDKVASRDILAGSQLTAADFAPADDRLAAKLTGSERVVSLPLDTAHGLIGQIAAGDRVDVYGGFNVLPLQKDGTPVAGGQTRPVLKLIVPDVEVVEVGGKTAGSGVSSVTLRTGDRQAADLAFASDNGKVWLALRPASGAASSAPRLVTVESLLLGVPAVAVERALGGQQ